MKLRKNKIKILSKNLILSALGGMVLVGCNSNNVGDVSNAAPNKLLSDYSPINDVKNEVWFNVSQIDWAGTDGRTSILMDNQSSSAISIVGCEDGGFDVTGALPLNVGAHRELTIDQDKGKYAAVQEQPESNVMTIKTGGLGHGAGYCYYKIHLNDLDYDLFVKLNINKEDYSTQSALFQEINQPYKDMESVSKRINDPSSSLYYISDLLAPLSGVGSYNLLRIPKEVIVKSNAIAIENFAKNVAKLQTQGFEGFMEQLRYIRSLPVAEQEAAWKELYQDMYNTTGGMNLTVDLPNHHLGSKVPQDEVINNLKKIDRYELRYSEVAKSDRYVPVDKNGNLVGEILDMNTTDPAKAWTTASRSFKQELSDINSATRIFINETKDYLANNPNITLERLYMYGGEENRAFMTFLDGKKVSGELGGFPTIIADKRLEGIIPKRIAEALEPNPLIKNAKLITVDIGKYTEQDLVSFGLSAETKALVKRGIISSALVSTGIGLAVEALTWFGVQPFLEALGNDSAFGQFATGLTHGYLSVPSAQDVSNWNTAHPDKKIADSTEYLNSSINSVEDELLITVKPIGGEQIDRSTTIKLSLTPLTTPFIRPEKVNNAKGEMSDPYDYNIKTNNDANSVLMLSVSSVGDDNLSGRDNSYELMKNVFDAYNLGGELASLLAAPEVSTTNVVKYTNNVNDAIANGSKGLLKTSTSNGLKLPQVGGIQGLFIKPNELITLTASIPSSNLKGDGDLYYGNGYSLQYVSSDDYVKESEIVADYQIVKTTKKFNEKVQSGGNALLAMSDTPMPYLANSPVNLQLAITGDSGASEHGKLYIGDAYGYTTSIPVYLNYALLAEPTSLTGETGDSVTFTIANMSDKDYSALEVNGLPSGAVISQQELSGLKPGEQRLINVDLSNVSKIGDYTIVIKGANGNQIKPNDIQKISLNVLRGW